MINWLLIAENAALLNWIGFLFGGIGLLLTLVGLRIALKQLKAIKSETEASTAAIESVHLKVSAFDTAQECQNAKALIIAIQGHLQQQDWLSIIDGYEKLIQSFLRLSHSHSPIVPDDRALLQKMTFDMAKMCEGLRRKMADTSGPVVIRGQDQALRDFSDIMTKITFAVSRDLQQ